MATYEQDEFTDDAYDEEELNRLYHHIQMAQITLPTVGKTQQHEAFTSLDIQVDEHVLNEHVCRWSVLDRLGITESELDPEEAYVKEGSVVRSMATFRYVKPQSVSLLNGLVRQEMAVMEGVASSNTSDTMQPHSQKDTMSHVNGPSNVTKNTIDIPENSFTSSEKANDVKKEVIAENTRIERVEGGTDEAWLDDVLGL